MTLRVGLLSTANINRLLLGGARAAEGVEVVAVASRERERAESYAAEHGLGRAHGSYDALLADDEVDAVYVPLPNSLHVEWSIRALEAGKHVLCEKPLTRHPEQAEAAFDAAERAGRVLAEGFMWRHHPQALRLQELAGEGAIGTLRLVRASFSFDIFGMDRPDDVRLQAGLEGGGLMDVGCYCVSALRLLAGEPERVRGRRIDGGDGVDVRFTGTMAFGGGVLGSFDCGLDMVARHELEVVGDAGVAGARRPVARALADDRAAPRPGRGRDGPGRVGEPVRARARGLRGGRRAASASTRSGAPTRSARRGRSPRSTGPRESGRDEAACRGRTAARSATSPTRARTAAGGRGAAREAAAVVVGVRVHQRAACPRGG